MASNRITKESALQLWFPEYTMESMDIEELLAKEINEQEIDKRVPVNTPLLASIEREGILNPFLCMDNYWCIAGQQRLRCAKEIKMLNPEWTCRVNVFVIKGKPWEPLFLWEDEHFRNDAVAIYFQMIELIFKSRFYIYEKDHAGENMRLFEELGDRAKWKHDN